jgi:hypothetical protein
VAERSKQRTYLVVDVGRLGDRAGDLVAKIAPKRLFSRAAAVLTAPSVCAYIGEWQRRFPAKPTRMTE